MKKFFSVSQKSYHNFSVIYSLHRYAILSKHVKVILAFSR